MMLCLICTTISRVDHARYEVPGYMYLGTVFFLIQRCVPLGSMLCETGKNTNPRFRFKIKASYIVSTEGDVRRVTILALKAT